jgi:hypothetical protein
VIGVAWVSPPSCGSGWTWPQPPGYQDLLSFLPPDECEILLRGAGYTPAGHLAETGTTDRLLREWIRSWQPIALDDGQRSALAACCDAAQVRNVAGPLREYPVELRRSLVAGSGVDRAAPPTMRQCAL